MQARPMATSERPRLGRRWVGTLVAALVLGELAIMAWFMNRGGPFQGQLTVWIFAFALAALVPLAALIGDVTEVLAHFLHPTIGGLLDASLSNVPELAIGISLLVHARAHGASPGIVTSDFDIIRGLLIGSVINNVLLTLGLAVFTGALKNGRMRFRAEEAAGYASMLALAVVGLALPTLAADFAIKRTAQAIDIVSLLVSVILILTYVLYIANSTFGWGDRKRARVAAPAPTLPARAPRETDTEKLIGAEERDDARDQARLRQELAAERARYRGEFYSALAALGLVTILTVVMAIILVSVTNNVIASTPLTPLSTGLILFPIVCNLGEAASALVTARAGDMEMAMSVAAGSSVQVPIFVTPLLVLISFAIAAGNTNEVLSLIFKPLELIVVGLVTFVYALVNLDGETTWLEGLQLLALYAMIAITAFALPGR